MHHAPGNITTPGHCHLEGSHSQANFHPRIDGVAYDPPRVDVLDRTNVQLALGGRLLGNLGQPQFVGRIRGEDALGELVVYWRTEFCPVLRPGLAEGAPTGG